LDADYYSGDSSSCEQILRPSSIARGDEEGLIAAIIAEWKKTKKGRWTGLETGQGGLKRR